MQAVQFEDFMKNLLGKLGEKLQPQNVFIVRASFIFGERFFSNETSKLRKQAKWK